MINLPRKLKSANNNSYSFRNKRAKLILIFGLELRVLKSYKNMNITSQILFKINAYFSLDSMKPISKII